MNNNKPSLVYNSIKLNNDYTRELVKDLNNCSNKLESFLINIEKKEITFLQSSWISRETERYMERVYEANRQMRSLIDIINKLAKQYEEIIDESETVSNNISNIIKNMF